MDIEARLQKSVQLHNEATDLADEAFFARRARDLEAELRFTREAFSKEAKSAELLRHDPSHHMHAILHRSAATLAYRCGEYKTAEKLIFHGLIADPEGRSRDELYDLLAKVRFRLSINSEAPPLENDELVMTLQGPDADNGLLELSTLADQINRWGTLITTTASLVSGLGFDDRAKVNRSYRVLAAPPAKGSFKIIMKQMPIGQSHLPGFEIVESVNARIIESFDTLNRGRLAALQSSFDDEAYYHEFMRSATYLAPDGQRITALGIEAGLSEEKRTVLFDRTRDDLESVYIPSVLQVEQDEFRLSDESESVVGELKFADDLKETGEIQLIAEDGKKWQIQVDEGLAAKVVKPHFGDTVIVTGRRLFKDRKRNRLRLDDIQAAE